MNKDIFKRMIRLMAVAIVIVAVVVGIGTRPTPGIGIIGGADGPTAIYLSNGGSVWMDLLMGLIIVMGIYALWKKRQG